MGKNIKLGVTYSVFSGEELLKKSIESIRENVDYINVVYQKISWTGNKASEYLLPLLKSLKEEGLIDNIIEYRVNYGGVRSFDWATRETCKKKNLGIRDLKKNRCTHCLIMDTDEFYRRQEFRAAKEFVIDNNITHSCCSIYDYKVSPQYRTKETVNYSVPFIFKLNWYSFINGRSNMPCLVDNLRTFVFIPFLHKFYFLNIVNMHHMTGVRYDIEEKLSNTLSNYDNKSTERINTYRIEFSDMLESESYLLSKGYIKVEDEFGICNQKD